jgi:hypothetical protein
MLRATDRILAIQFPSHGIVCNIAAYAFKLYGIANDAFVEISLPENLPGGAKVLIDTLR